MRHVILGAGPLGFEVFNLIRSDGHDASIYSTMGNRAYDMVGSHEIQIDGGSTSDVGAACSDSDVIYLLLNAHYVDWHDLFPPRLKAAMEAARTSGATLVYHDNVYPYGPSDDVLTEETAQNPITHKGRLRKQMAERFLSEVAAGRIKGVIGRSADMYGPGALNSSFNSTLGERHFRALLADKPVPLLGNVDEPHTYAYVTDVATGLVRLGAEPESLGEIWHLPAAPTVSHRDLLAYAFEAAGVDGHIRSSAVAGLFVKAIGLFQKDVGEVAEMMYQFKGPLEVSHDKYAAKFEVDVTPHVEAMRRTIGWYRTYFEGAT